MKYKFKNSIETTTVKCFLLMYPFITFIHANLDFYILAHEIYDVLIHRKIFYIH